MFPFLTLVFGLGWTVTYIACIRLGFRDRTYCMPAVALALNFSWECVFTAHALQEALGLQTVVNIVWTVLDAAILVTFLRFGRTEQPRPIAGALRLLTSLRDGRDIEAQPVSRVAAVYSAFLINVFMSFAFLAMAATRPPGRGQSRVIAVSKLVGTLGATAAFGIVASSAFVLGLGIICAVLDVLYLIVVIRDIDRRTSTATAAEPASRASVSQDL
jgi:hypothetical protein